MSMSQHSPRREEIYFFVIVLLSVPVLLLNLGRVPFIEDEGIRALVALEMDLSDNFIAPTLNGEPYFKKPPLWNWILLVSFKLFREQNEFTARLPMLLCLYGFSLTIYFFVKRRLGTATGALTALMLLTCGRILFWDSILALIDIAFSWVIFIMFIWIYHYEQHRRFLMLYLGAYFLCFIAFMLKALPSVVFLGLTLLITQVHRGTWRKLFSWQHLVGSLAFFIPLGIYLYSYQQEQPLSNLVWVIVDESTQRTILKFGLLSTLRQVVTFPFEMFYHFLPWSIMTILLFIKGIRKHLTSDPFITFAGFTFLINIGVYWTSPQVYPRYLFMLAPLFFVIGVYLYNRADGLWPRKTVDIFLKVLGISVLLGSVVLFFHDDTSAIKGLWWKWSLAAVGMGTALALMQLLPERLLHWFCIYLLAARLGFGMIVLPARSVHGQGTHTKADAQRIGSVYRDAPLAIYRSDTMRYEASFYITRERGKIVPVVEEEPDSGYLLVNPMNYPTLITRNQVVDSVRVRREEKFTYLVSLGQEF